MSPSGHFHFFMVLWMCSSQCTKGLERRLTMHFNTTRGDWKHLGMASSCQLMFETLLSKLFDCMLHENQVSNQYVIHIAEKLKVATKQSHISFQSGNFLQQCIKAVYNTRPRKRVLWFCNNLMKTRDENATYSNQREEVGFALFYTKR